jgi:uncharacterized protein (DUF736 family)
MLKCGTLESIANNTRYQWRGTIVLGKRIDTPFVMIANARAKQDDNRIPDYFLFELIGGIASVKQIGSAWLKNSDRGDFDAITLDDVDWLEPVYVTAFPPDVKNEPWQIVWSRPRAERHAA